jgi:ABC-type methionine transport system permease subunit
MHSHGFVNAMATLKVTLQSLKDSNQEVSVLCIDSAKALGTVTREMMRKILAKYMIPEPLVNVIVTMYTDIEVSTSGGKTPP